MDRWSPSIAAAWLRIFRYDFFLSYSWSDGRRYAEALLRQLEAAPYRYRCFLDNKEMGGGVLWRATVDRALRRSSAMILVLSPAAVDSDNVFHEVSVFSTRGRPLIPIVFGDGDFEIQSDHRLFALLEERIRAQEGNGITALAQGLPSDAIVNYLDMSFSFLRVARIRAAIVVATIAVLLGLLIVALQQRQQARWSASQATQESKRATSRSLAARSDLLRVTDPEHPALAALLAVQALSTHWTAEAERAVRAAVSLIPAHTQRLVTLSQTISELRFASVNDAVIATSNSGEVAVFQNMHGQRVQKVIRRPCHLDLTTKAHERSSRETSAFSENGRYLATFCWLRFADGTVSDGTILVYDLVTLTEIGRYSTGNLQVKNLFITDDGLRVVAGFYGIGHVAVWNNGRPAPSFLPAATLLTMERSGRYVAILTKNTINLLDLRGNTATREIRVGQLTAVSNWNSSKQLFAIAESDNNVLVLSEKLQPILSKTVDDIVTKLEINADGTYIAVATKPRARNDSPEERVTSANAEQVRLLRIADGWWAPPIVVGGWANIVKLNAKGDMLAVATVRVGVFEESELESVRVWNPMTGRELMRLGDVDKITALAMSDNGSEILTGTDKGEMTIWDASRVEFGDAVYGAYTWQNSLSFDERLLGTSGSSAGRSSAGIWDREDHREVLRLPPDRLGNSADEMRSVAFHPAAPLIATVNMDGNLQFWNRTDGAAVSSARMPSNASLLFVAFDRTGEHIIVADNEHSLWIAEVKAVEKPLQIDIGGMPVSIAVASDADVVATVALQSMEVRLWDIKSGKIKRVVAVRDTVDAVSMSSNAKTLATASGKVVRLWDLASGKPTGEVIVHDQRVNSVAFSLDGDFIAVATGVPGTDGTTGVVDIWNLRSREELSVLPHAKGVRDVIFSAHPPRLLTASGWQVDEWTWQPADLIAEACKRLTRPLSEEEWAAFVGTTSYLPACGNVR